MSVAQLRAAFSSGRGKRGLLLIDGRWRLPEKVFAGPRIFGGHRPFVPSSPLLDPLWRTLGLRSPDAQDCIAVLRKMALAPLAPADAAIVLETTRALASKLGAMSPQLRARLLRLPLWVGDRWESGRPVYAFEDPSLALQAATQVLVWQPGFSSLAGIAELLGPLGVTLLRTDDFAPVAVNGRGVIAGNDLRRRFAVAIQHLRNELARGDQPLHDSLTVRWGELCAAQVFVESGLELTARANDRSIVVAANAHMLRKPLALVVGSAEYAGTADAGGRAIASLFSGDQQKVAWAWVSMWQRAGEGLTPEEIILSTGKAEEDADRTERLIHLKGQAGNRRASRGGTRDNGSTSIVAGETGSVEVRSLKDISELEPDEGPIVNRGEARGGAIFPARRPASTGSGRDGPSRDASMQSGSRSARRTVPPPMSEREQLAFEAVRRALRLDPPQIVDLRARRGLGADAMDDLRQLFEIKMESSDEFPNDVTLTRSEVEAAQNDPDFFLAVVAGLDKGSGELRVRFIFNPLKCLAIRIGGDATLSGVREVEALEYRFRKPNAQ